MSSAVQPPVNAIQAIHRVSPSRYTSLLKCALREAWSASRVQAALPAAAAAHVGSITHGLLDRAAKGGYAGFTREQIATEWDRLVAAKEAELLADPVERLNVPLRERVFRFAVRKIRTVNRAFETASDFSKPRADAVPVPGQGSEIWVATEDGTIGGYIDSAVKADSGIAIRDYKTGAVLDEETGEVLPAYTTQLKLYAGLYHEQFGVWPSKLELINLRGDSIPVPFSIDECQSLLVDARKALAETNSAIANNRLDLLASPSPDTCKYCVYRPFCSCYIEARRTVDRSGAWPNDALGTLLSTEIAGDERIAISLSDDFADGDTIRVLGLTPGSQRHPALKDVMPGDRLSLFNLRASHAPNTFGESPKTVILPLG
jgi:RecB family exonuclease